MENIENELKTVGELKKWLEPIDDNALFKELLGDPEKAYHQGQQDAFIKAINIANAMCAKEFAKYFGANAGTTMAARISEAIELEAKKENNV